MPLGCGNGVITSVFFPCQVLTTIEGIIDRAVAGLEQDQPARRVRGQKGEAPQGWQMLGMSIPCPVVSHRAGGESTGALLCAMVTFVSSSGLPLQQLNPIWGVFFILNNSVTPCPLPGDGQRGGKENRRVHWETEAAERSQFPLHLCECSQKGSPDWVRGAGRLPQAPFSRRSSMIPPGTALWRTPTHRRGTRLSWSLTTGGAPSNLPCWDWR